MKNETNAAPQTAPIVIVEGTENGWDVIAFNLNGSILRRKTCKTRNSAHALQDKWEAKFAKAQPRATEGAHTPTPEVLRTLPSGRVVFKFPTRPVRFVFGVRRESRKCSDPRDWVIVQNLADGGDYVCQCDPDATPYLEQEAAFIAAACNSHAANLRRIEDLEDMLLHALPCVEESEQYDKPHPQKLSRRIRAALQPTTTHYASTPEYAARIEKLEAQGLTRSDAQGVADAEFRGAISPAPKWVAWPDFDEPDGDCNSDWNVGREGQSPVITVYARDGINAREVAERIAREAR